MHGPNNYLVDNAIGFPKIRYIKNYQAAGVRAHFGQSNFLFFQQKRKQEILLILIIFTYFKVQTKIQKKENGQEN